MSKNIIKKKLTIKIVDCLGHFATCDRAVEKLKIATKELKEEKSVYFKLRKGFINEYITRWAKDYKEKISKKNWEEYLKIFMNATPGPPYSKQL